MKDMEIKQMIIPFNQYNRPNQKQTPKKICIHYTGNRGSGAIANARYYLNVGAGMFKNSPASTWTSAQYIIGLSGECIQCVPDNYISQSASGNNKNVIHIEVCYQNNNGKFEDVSVETLKELVSSLMTKYRIAEKNVVRHYDLTGKLCPIYYVQQPDEWKKLKSYITGTKKSSVLYKVQCGAFADFKYASNMKNTLINKGFDAFIDRNHDTGMFIVQAGAFSKKINAINYLKSIEKETGIRGFVNSVNIRNIDE